MRKLIIISILMVLVSNVYSQYKYSPSFYEVLGMLDEYMSRFDWNTGKPNGDLVEAFYPHEEKLADDFQKLIAMFEKERNENYLVQKQIGDQGHIYFYSAILSNEINSLYRLDSNKIASLEPSLVLSTSPDRKTSFIKGAYKRYGNKHRIHMANAPKKMELIGLVLKSLNCQDIIVYRTKGTLPIAYVVTFEPDSKLEAVLKEIEDNKEYDYFNQDDYIIYKTVN